MRTSFYDSVDQSPETDVLHSRARSDRHLTANSYAEFSEVPGALFGISFFFLCFFVILFSFLEVVPFLFARCLY